MPLANRQLRSEEDMFILVCTIAYAALFIGLVLLYLPARLIPSASGLKPVMNSDEKFNIFSPN